MASEYRQRIQIRKERVVPGPEQPALRDRITKWSDRIIEVNLAVNRLS
jgi:hypothetical protein